MNNVLLVVGPFAGHAVGDLITEAAAIREVQSSAHAHDVIKVMAPCAVPDISEET